MRQARTIAKMPRHGLATTDLRDCVQRKDSLSRRETKDLILASRDDVLVFGAFVFGWYPASHHEEWMDFVLYNKAGLLATDDCGISAPPAFAKTNYIGIVLSAWYLGKYPERHIIYTSKTGLQAEKVSNAVRDTIEKNPRFRLIFPHCLPDRDRGWGEKEWYLQRPNTGDKDASFFAVGIGGPILNARGDLIIIDDPQDKTTSGTPFQREKAIGYIKEQVLTRKTSIGRAVTIMTRWHTDDIAGYMQKQRRVRWRTLPALRCVSCDHGSCICGKHQWRSTWANEWPTRKLLTLRDEDPILFEKIYQGNPRNLGNTLFPEAMWKYYDPQDIPPMDWTVQVWDTAQKEEEQSSYSVCAYWGKNKTGYYVLGLWRDRVPYPVLLKTAKLLYHEQQPREVVIEDKSSGVQLAQSFEAETNIPVQRIKSQETKWERARAISPIQNTGRVYLPKDAPWVYDFIEEHAGFPGKFTDQVDTTAHALTWLRGIGEIDISPGTADEVLERFRGTMRETPDVASLDWVATRTGSRWRRFSKSKNLVGVIEDEAF